MRPLCSPGSSLHVLPDLNYFPAHASSSFTLCTGQSCISISVVVVFFNKGHLLFQYFNWPFLLQTAKQQPAKIKLQMWFWGRSYKTNVHLPVNSSCSSNTLRSGGDLRVACSLAQQQPSVTQTGLDSGIRRSLSPLVHKCFKSILQWFNVGVFS